MTTPDKPFQRLLLTGAAGGLGRVLRSRLRELAHTVRVSDREDCGPAQAGEEVVPADLADAHAVHRMMEGVEAVLQFGGVSLEDASRPECVCQGGPSVLSTPMALGSKEPR